MSFKMEEVQERLIDEGNYQAVIVEAKEIYPKNTQSFLPYLKLIFEIQKGEFAGERIQKNFYSSYENKKRAKMEREALDSLTSSIFGEHVGEVETDQYVGSEIGITVSHYNGNHQIKKFWQAKQLNMQELGRAVPPQTPQKLEKQSNAVLDDDVPF